MRCAEEDFFYSLKQFESVDKNSYTFIVNMDVAHMAGWMGNIFKKMLPIPVKHLHEIPQSLIFFQTTAKQEVISMHFLLSDCIRF